MSLKHTVDPRAAIRVLALIRRLEQYVLKDEEMKPAQITAALALLKKVLPDLDTASADTAQAAPHEDALQALE